MKYYKKLKLWKASSVVFNPETMIATSYGWWEFVKRIKGEIVFNDYGYSVSTRRHQKKIKYLLTELGLAIDVVIEAPKGLQDLTAAIDHYKNKITELDKQIQKPKSRFQKNEERTVLIRQYQEIITKIEKMRNS